MHIAYLTADEVNLDLARRWAQECGCQLSLVLPRDALPDSDGEFDAVVYDLDCPHPALRERVLTNLLTGDHHSRVAVHTYNLGQAQAQELRARGVLVERRLERMIIRCLAADRGMEMRSRMPIDGAHLRIPPRLRSSFQAACA